VAGLFDKLEPEHIDFISRQKIFFVGTNSKEEAPNVSPKGAEPLKIIDNRTAAYLDYHGSGNRTALDIAEGSPVTIMFCSFDKKPLILRLFCKGRVIRDGETEFAEILRLWEREPSNNIRQVFRLDVYSVQTSCGWGVPMYDFAGERTAAGKMKMLESSG
jgi:hypothetical protein